MRFLVVGLPRFPPPPEQLPAILEAEPQWYERWRASLELHGWFPGGGGFAVVNVDNEAALNRCIGEHPFNPFSEVQVRPFVDHDTGLGQLQEVVRAMGGRA